ncbi:acetyl-coenzyme A synthetase, chloroplastic/glyoxysomal-like [Curcuma longa]|uniref:acetyl-coenzyme A synthetase, chloroplastic/glyoxysomal-like n=1 Tax=Curcuma longa TaxID=136217 RepID=UPI003D9FB099
MKWFKGGITNICYNALDRNIEAGNGDKVALYWEGNEPGQDGQLTYAQLLDQVCQLANYLKHVGVRKGDAVVIYLPMLMELPIAMLACARIGAVHSVVFAGFSAESLAQRIIDCKPKVVICCNAVRRGAKEINLKAIVDNALVESANNGIAVDLCLVYENQSTMKKEDNKWHDGRDILWQNSHPCVKGAMHHDCPVCFEYLFESRNDVSVLMCGHTIHMQCLKEMQQHLQYACPLCSKSVCDMSKEWEIMDREIAATPMPTIYHDKKCCKKHSYVCPSLC